MKGRQRTYRHIMSSGDLTSFRVAVQETDLYIRSRPPLADLARETVMRLRGHLEAYIQRHPTFLDTLLPWPLDDPAPPVVRAMIAAGRLAGVGPMAAVAGAIAEGVGQALLAHSPDVIVENGGDIFVKARNPVTIGLFAGGSPLSLKVGLRVSTTSPKGVCTSSGTVGHSLSFGRANAVCIVSADTALADAAATAVGNLVAGAADIAAGIELAGSIPGVEGVVIVCGQHMGAWGEVELMPLSCAPPGRRAGKRG